MSDPVKYDGVTVRIAGRDWTVPPLSFKQLRRLAPKFAALGSVSPTMDEAQLDGVLDIVHAALSRNYAELTREQVEEMIDLGNVRRIVSAIAGVSGLVPLGEAEAGDRRIGMS